jgi:hypothetical protein
MKVDFVISHLGGCLLQIWISKNIYDRVLFLSCLYSYCNDLSFIHME